MSDFYSSNAMLELFAALVTVVLFIGCLTEQRRLKRTDRLFVALLCTQVLLLCGDAAIWMLSNTISSSIIPLLRVLNLLVDLLVGVMAVLYTLFLYSYISDRQKVSPWFCRVMLVICGAMLVLSCTCLFSDRYIQYRPDGSQTVGSLYYLMQTLVFLLLVANMIYPFCHFRILGWKDTAILMSYGVLPLCSMPLEIDWSITPPLLAITLSLLLVYVVLHAQQTRLAAQRKLLLAQQELELTDSRTKIMLSQLQPHFLYNVLNSIYHLCDMDPSLAQEMVEYFSDYLRNNMASLEQTGLIPFSEEYQHIQTYLSLERIRFAKTLDVVYNIEATEFKLPPLTIQPLVENAVRHGVTKKRGGGSVTLTTYETESAFVVVVADTGRGFDPEHYADDGKVHIGIKSVRERLKTMCSGTLTIESQPDCGTTATVTIPKEGAAEQ